MQYNRNPLGADYYTIQMQLQRQQQQQLDQYARSEAWLPTSWIPPPLSSFPGPFNYPQGFGQQRSAEPFSQDYMHAERGYGLMHMPQMLPPTIPPPPLYNSTALQMPPSAAAITVPQQRRLLKIEAPPRTGGLKAGALEFVPPSGTSEASAAGTPQSSAGDSSGSVVANSLKSTALSFQPSTLSLQPGASSFQPAGFSLKATAPSFQTTVSTTVSSLRPPSHTFQPASVSIQPGSTAAPAIAATAATDTAAPPLPPASAPALGKVLNVTAPNFTPSDAQPAKAVEAAVVAPPFFHSQPGTSIANRRAVPIVISLDGAVAAARASAARAADELLLGAVKSGGAREHAEQKPPLPHENAVTIAASSTTPPAVAAKYATSGESTSVGGKHATSRGVTSTGGTGVEPTVSIPQMTVSGGQLVKDHTVTDTAPIGPVGHQQVPVNSGFTVRHPVAVVPASAQLPVSGELQGKVPSGRASLWQQLPVSSAPLRFGNFTPPPSPRSLAAEEPVFGVNQNPPPNEGGADGSELTAVVPDTEQSATMSEIMSAMFPQECPGLSQSASGLRPSPAAVSQPRPPPAKRAPYNPLGYQPPAQATPQAGVQPQASLPYPPLPSVVSCEAPPTSPLVETATGSFCDTSSQAHGTSPVSSAAAAAAAVSAPQSEALSAASVRVAAPVASHAASMAQPASSWASLVSKRTQLPVPQPKISPIVTASPMVQNKASVRPQQKGGQVRTTTQAAAAERTRAGAATRAGIVTSEGPAVKPGSKKAVRAAGEKAARQNGAAGGVVSLSKGAAPVPTWASASSANGGVVGAGKQAVLPGGINTELLCCPLTLDVMVDPVTALDGHTYERLAIEEWFAKSDVSPMQNVKLESKVLIPNVFIRQYIEKWMQQRPSNDLGV